MSINYMPCKRIRVVSKFTLHMNASLVVYGFFFFFDVLQLAVLRVTQLHSVQNVIGIVQSADL